MPAKASPDVSVARLASAIGDPARAKILYCLLDGRARTSTELSAVAEVTASTASIHLHRLKAERLVTVLAQGKHRYYSLAGPDVARVLEGLMVLAGGVRKAFVPSTPHRLRAARTCYDHLAGSLGVLLHDRLRGLGWIEPHGPKDATTYALTTAGTKGLAGLGLEFDEPTASRRRLAFGCLDWSERRYHLGGAVGAAILRLAVKRKWVLADLDSRALAVTAFGRREFARCFGLILPLESAEVRRDSA